MGYGNIGRYTLEAVEAAPDMEVAGIVRRNGAQDKPFELTNYDVVADNVSFCGSKSESGNNFGARQDSAPAVSYQSAAAGSFSVLPDDNQGFPFADDDEGLPF